jgi:hypothetical protein
LEDSHPENGGKEKRMEVGQSLVSTEEYMELRAIKDNLEARKAEIEANADKIMYVFGTMVIESAVRRFTGKDEALKMLQADLDATRNEAKEAYAEVISLRRRHPKTTLVNRLRFLFTGKLEYETTE